MTPTPRSRHLHYRNGVNRDAARMHDDMHRDYSFVDSSAGNNNNTGPMTHITLNVRISSAVNKRCRQDTKRDVQFPRPGEVITLNHRLKRDQQETPPKSYRVVRVFSDAKNKSTAAVIVTQISE